jgi:hypothetical protein
MIFIGTYPYSTDFKFSVGEFDYGSLDLKVGKYGSLDLKLTDFGHIRYTANRVRTTHRKDGRGRGGGGVAHSLTGQSQPQHPLSVFLYKDAVNLNKDERFRDGILGHQYNKRIKYFSPCYAQSLRLADIKENHTYSSLVFKNPFKKIHETRKLESIHE